jgi:hypothetical protein
MENPNPVSRIRHILTLAQLILSLVLLALEIIERIQHFF